MRRATALLLTAVLLSGCGPLIRVTKGPGMNAMLQQTQQEAGAPLVVTGPIPQPDGGQLAIFRYRKGDQCGDGYVLTDADGRGGASRGEGPCDLSGGLSFGGSSDEARTILHGVVNAPGVTRIVVTTTDGKEVDGNLGNGVWWLVLTPGQPNGTFRVKALDSTGKVLAEAP